MILDFSDEGRLILDTTEEKSFDLEKTGFDLKMGLDISENIERGKYYVGNVECIVEIKKYIEEWCRNNGCKLELSIPVKTVLSRIEEERKVLSRLAREQRIHSKKSWIEPFYSFSRSLLPHQEKSLESAISMYNPADFSVPGSGKTCVALGFFEYLKKNNIVQKLFVIGPLSSFMPWEEEFRLCFGREPHSVRLKGDRWQRSQVFSRVNQYESILCSYQMAHQEEDSIKKSFQQYKWLLVLDEAHNIKRYMGGAWSQSLLGIAPFATRRMILTGTPAPYGLFDLWTQFSFLWVSRLLVGTRYEFETNLETKGEKYLREKIKPYFIRVTKSELGLPPYELKSKVIRKKEWPPIQRKIIGLLELETMQQIRKIDLGEKDLITLKRWRRARIIRLLQAASNPALIESRTLELGDPGDAMDLGSNLTNLVKNYNQKEKPAKIDWCERKARELISNGRKVLIWTSFIGNIRLLQSLLADLEPLVVFGEIKPFEEPEDTRQEESREGNIREFKLSKTKNILIANPSACAESISLHKECHDAIYVERTFNCGQFLQSMDRIHRVGLLPGIKTTYHIPVMDSAIDRLVDRRLYSRQKVLYELLSDKSIPIGGWSEDGLVEEEEDIDHIIEELHKELIHDAKVGK
jgi:SNF2 family DNA or RNA helicase